jgi:ADP-heptose:LPS heptosyltransferase
MNILLLRLSSLGDCMLTTPVVGGLAALPNARVVVATRPAYAQVYANNPHVAQCIEVNTNLPFNEQKKALVEGGPYDCVIDLHDSLRTRLLRRGLSRRIMVVYKRALQRRLLVSMKIDLMRGAPDVLGRYFETVSSLSVVDDGTGPELFIGGTPLPDGAWFASANPVIAIAPGARHFTKRYPADLSAQVVARLIERGMRVLIVGGGDDREIVDDVIHRVDPGIRDFILDRAGSWSIHQTARALDACAAVLTNDSGLMHIAWARKRPTIAIFGSTVHQFGFVPRSGCTVLEREGLSCRPCSHVGRAECPKGHFNCMREIAVEDVVRGVFGGARSVGVLGV